MYKTIVAGKVRDVFTELSNGKCELLVEGLAPDAVHTVDGSHALSGVRSTPEDIKAWYTRLGLLFPDLTFDVHEVVVKGLPWKTTAIAVWNDSSSTELDEPFQNAGVNVIELAWGKVQAIRVYTDSEYLGSYLAKLGEHQPEAIAEPIVS